MMTPLKMLPPIVGGEEQSYRFLFEQRIMDTTRYEILDLTGFEYRVEVEFESELVMSLSESDGIERLEDDPPDESYAHYELTLNESKSDRLPIGVMLMKLIRISPAGVTKIDLVNLKRVA